MIRSPRRSPLRQHLPAPSFLFTLLTLLIVFASLVSLQPIHAAQETAQACTTIQVTSVLRMEDMMSVTLIGDGIRDVEEGVLVPLTPHAVRIEQLPPGTKHVTIYTPSGTCTRSIPEASITDSPDNPESILQDIPTVPDWLFSLRTILNTSLSLVKTLDLAASVSCTQANTAFQSARTLAKKACQGYTREDLTACTDPSCLACKQAYNLLLTAEEARDTACDRLSCQPVLSREAHATEYTDPLFGDSVCATSTDAACEEEYVRVQSPRCPFFNVSAATDIQTANADTCSILKDPQGSLFSAFQCQCYPTLEAGIQNLLDETNTAIDCFSSGESPRTCLSTLAYDSCREAVLLFTPPCLTASGSLLNEIFGDTSDPFIVKLFCGDPLTPVEDLTRFAYTGIAKMSLNLICPEGNTSAPCLCPLDSADPLATNEFCGPPNACVYGLGCTKASSETAPNLPPTVQRISSTDRLDHLPSGVDEEWHPESVWLNGPDGRSIVEAEKRFLGLIDGNAIRTLKGMISRISCSETSRWVFWTQENDTSVWLFRAKKEQESFSLQKEKRMIKSISCQDELPSVTIVPPEE